MLRYLQPSSWFFVMLALILGFYYSTKVLPKKSGSQILVAPATFISFTR